MEADEDQTDSTFGDGSSELGGTTTTSIRSAITKYEFENGRRYHAYKAGQYVFPNDETELERMDIEHHNQGLMLGALHLCPLKAPQEILDIGTGSGVWAIDMADQYPSASIIGTDLSPVQPTSIPPNLRFYVDDFEEEWTFGSNRFDLVHARFIMSCVSDYSRLYKEAFDSIKPGGYFEILDMESGCYSDDGTLPEDSATVKWWRLLSEATDKIGRSIPKVGEHKTLMEGAGFVDVQDLVLKRPTNDWPKDPEMKEIGRVSDALELSRCHPLTLCDKFSCLNYLQGLEGFTLAPFTRILGWTVEEVQVFLAQVRTESTNRKMHGYQKGYYFVCPTSSIILLNTFQVWWHGVGSLARMITAGQQLNTQHSGAL